jgi:hypothetical protein
VTPNVSKSASEPVFNAKQPLRGRYCKRFCSQIVVRAGLETLDLLRPAVAGCQDQDGKIMSARAPGAKHFDAGDLRQTKVQHSGVILLSRAEMLAVFAIAGDVDDAAFRPQKVGDPAGEFTIIFDEKYAHNLTIGVGVGHG